MPLVLVFIGDSPSAGRAGTRELLQSAVVCLVAGRCACGCTNQYVLCVTERKGEERKGSLPQLRVRQIALSSVPSASCELTTARPRPRPDRSMPWHYLVLGMDMDGRRMGGRGWIGGEDMVRAVQAGPGGASCCGPWATDGEIGGELWWNRHPGRTSASRFS